jgi:hypothetical protein
MPEKMQKTMNNQMGKVIRQRQALGRGFGGNSFAGKHDIAKQRPESAGNHRRRREGQDISGPVHAPILPVQVPDMGVVGENQRHLGPVGDRRQRAGFAAGRDGAVNQLPKLGLRRPVAALQKNVGDDRRALRRRGQDQIPAAGGRSALS